MWEGGGGGDSEGLLRAARLRAARLLRREVRLSQSRVCHSPKIIPRPLPVAKSPLPPRPRKCGRRVSGACDASSPSSRGNLR